MLKRSMHVLMVVVVVGLLLMGCSARGAQVSTLVGGTRGFQDGPSQDARFDSPQGVAVGSDGNLYVADMANRRIRKVLPDGLVSTLIGDGKIGHGDGPTGAGSIGAPVSIATNASGSLLVFADSLTSDTSPLYIREVSLDGTAYSLAGAGIAGSRDGRGNEALFRSPASVAMDRDGNIYVADSNNHRIRVVLKDGTVKTLAGASRAGNAKGFEDGETTSARFNNPQGIAVDKVGNLYIADSSNNAIRKFSLGGAVTTLAGTGEAGYADGSGKFAQFNFPTGLTVDAQGNLYVADSANHRIRKITPDGTVSTIAGSGEPGLKDGIGEAAQFRLPVGITIDPNGVLYVADTGNNAIRKIVLP